MPIESSGEVRLRGTAGDGRTDINEEINSNATDTDVSLGTLNTVAFTAVSDGSVVTGRAMSEMKGYSAFDSPFPSTQAAGALGESLYFGGSNEYIRRTTTLAGNSKTFTLSFWVKIEKVDSDNKTVFSHGNGGTDRFYCFFDDNKLYLYEYNGSSYTLQHEIDQIIDVTGWYHIVIANNTTKNSVIDRTRVYINGIEMSLITTTNYDKNDESYINTSSSTFAIGYDFGTSSDFFPGTIADFKSIDGQQLRPDSFGKLHEGIWIPQAFNTPSTDTLITSSLVADYQFQGNANDTSVGGTTYNGTPSNVTFLDNNYGIASFTGGSASQISLGTASQFASSTLTFSFWYMPTSAPSGTSYKILFSNYTNSFSDGFFNLSRNIDNSLEIGLYAGSGYFYRKTLPSAVELNAWTHVTIVLDNTYSSVSDKVKFYINGSDFIHTDNSSSGTPSGNFLNFSNSLLIGNWAHQSGYTDTSKFGELQIYTSALTETQVLQNYSATKHRYAYGINGFWLPLNNTSIGSIDSSSNLKLHLDASNNSSYGGSGTTWSDLSGNNYHATLSGATFSSTTNNGVFTFDGSDDFASIASNSGFQSLTEFALEMWINPVSVGDDEMINLLYTSGSNFKWDLRFSSGSSQNFRWGVANSSGAYVSAQDLTTNTSTGIVPLNKWSHVTATFSSANGIMNIYINGKLTDTKTGTFTTRTNGSENLLLAKRTDGYHANVKIAQFRLYNKALTAQEVITNYRATQGNYEQVNTVDISGNANSFAATNIDVVDHIKDEPLDNYPVMQHFPLAFGFDSAPSVVSVNLSTLMSSSSDMVFSYGSSYFTRSYNSSNGYVTIGSSSGGNNGGNWRALATGGGLGTPASPVAFKSWDITYTTSKSWGFPGPVAFTNTAINSTNITTAPPYTGGSTISGFLHANRKWIWASSNGSNNEYYVYLFGGGGNSEILAGSPGVATTTPQRFTFDSATGIAKYYINGVQQLSYDVTNYTNLGHVKGVTTYYYTPDIQSPSDFTIRNFSITV